MIRFVFALSVLMLAACNPESAATDACGGSGGGSSSAPAATSASSTVEGGATPACAVLDYAPGPPFAARCVEEAERCEHPTFGARVLPFCCPPEEPCAAPAPAARHCQPMLGSFLGWCCLPACSE